LYANQNLPQNVQVSIVVISVGGNEFLQFKFYQIILRWKLGYIQFFIFVWLW